MEQVRLTGEAALPPEIAKQVGGLLEKEQELLIKPPAGADPGQLDQQFADLRWEISEKLGLHDIEGAISYAQASLSLDEVHPDRWERLGDLYGLSGAVTAAQEAAVAYDNAVFLSPRALRLRQKLAAALLLLQRPRDALIHLEVGLIMANEQEEQKLIPFYTAACAVTREFERGIAFCRSLADAGSGSPQFRVALAILEKANGKPERALKVLAEMAQVAGIPAPVAEYASALRKHYEAGISARQ